ncbi:MAG: hypothetical protein H5T86_16430 [Armatimonadetes bacterium]|nr:hypothetical protein [Armatimonadota bacterium]
MRPPGSYKPRQHTYPASVRARLVEGKVLVEEGYDPYILSREMRAAGCTALERRAVLEFIATGSRRQAAQRLRLPRSVVAVLLSSAIEKLREWRAERRRERPYDAWLSVYVQEVNRWPYEPEQHCEPGKEACAKTGLCAHRWYLYHGEAL